MDNKKEIKTEYKTLEKERKSLLKRVTSIENKLKEIDIKEGINSFNKLNKNNYYIEFYKGECISLYVYKLDDKLNENGECNSMEFQFFVTSRNTYSFSIRHIEKSMEDFSYFYKKFKNNYLTGEEFVNFKIKAELAVARKDVSIIFDYLKNECKHCKID